MVAHGIMVRGVDMAGTEHKCPVILQMNDDDFPGHFLQDLASPSSPPVSCTQIVPSGQPLYQPVQRMLTLAMVDLRCDTLGFPRLDPKRIESAGLVIRRVYRVAGSTSGSYIDDYNTLSAWMRSAAGQYSWVKLAPNQECCDPEPTKRPQLKSGQAAVDNQLTAMYLSTAKTEITSPAYATPPAICASLGRTIVYAVIPTASSEVSDTPPKSPPSINRQDLATSLPALLRSKKYSSGLTVPSTTAIDYRWMSDDFLNDQYPPTLSSSAPPVSTADPNFTWFHTFATALRMLQTVFNTFNNQNEGAAILNLLNQHNVTFADGHTQPMGDFYATAKRALLDYNGYPTPTQPTPPAAPILTMPTSWDALSSDDEKALVDALIAAITPASKKQLTPQGRFQDSTRHYRLRIFFRIKSENPACPPELVWSQYSEPFQIAPWYATGNRVPPPIPLADPNSAFLQNAKPNCSFQVPGSLMSAMQGSTLSGLMKGAGGGGGLKLDWICGFNIPLITICAFFVLNIFLSLLNIIFFWLPFIKICIPFPSPSPSSPDDGAP
jgi:hypothetical protein